MSSFVASTAHKQVGRKIDNVWAGLQAQLQPDDSMQCLVNLAGSPSASECEQPCAIARIPNSPGLPVVGCRSPAQPRLQDGEACHHGGEANDEDYQGAPLGRGERCSDLVADDPVQEPSHHYQKDDQY